MKHNVELSRGDKFQSHELRQDTPISRRSFLGIAATAVGALAGGCSLNGSGSRRSSNQLNIYSWADYVHPDTIPEFERRYDIHVVYDTFASNESLLAKLQAGASDYDIVVPTSYMVTHLKELKLLAPLDHDKVPLLKNLISRFRNPAFDCGLVNSVPYTWGTTGIGYDASLFQSGGAGKSAPDDWDVFWDKRFAQRMTLLDDARETIGMSLKRNGRSYNTHDEAEIRQAMNDLKTQKPLVMCYTSDQVITQLAA
ncbi:MAG: ABC transporter substrate-binding protein, partial [Terriglobales bacterium]